METPYAARCPNTVMECIRRTMMVPVREMSISLLVENLGRLRLLLGRSDMSTLSFEGVT